MKMAYKVGDEVWFARCGNEHIQETCPVCYGKLEVTLILGNEDKIKLPCDYCRRGIGGPTGVINEYDYVSKPEQIRISQVDSKETIDGIIHEYHSLPYYHHEESLLFDTKEEALAKCIMIKEEFEKDQITRTENIKKSKNKSFSWNAGYHIGEAKRNRKSAEYHEKMAVICKQRVPKEKIHD